MRQYTDLINEMGTHPHYLWRDFFSKRKEEKSTVVEVLKENILFCTLSRSELKYLSRIVYERIYQPNEIVFHQNDRGFGMYVIAKGRVTIKTHSHEGDILVTTLSKGSFFGELSLVDSENIRSASAAAMEKTILIGFFMPDLVEILERKPHMGVKILFQLSTVLGKRLLETTEKITLLTASRGIERIYEDVI